MFNKVDLFFCNLNSPQSSSWFLCSEITDYFASFWGGGGQSRLGVKLSSEHGAESTIIRSSSVPLLGPLLTSYGTEIPIFFDSNA